MTDNVNTDKGDFGRLCPPSATTTCVGNDHTGSGLGPADGCAPECAAP